MPPRIWMLGLMGAGKTTVGRALATRLGWSYFDNDAELERRVGEKATVLVLGGAERLHEAEFAVAAAAASASTPVIACSAASVVDRDEGVELLVSTGRLVYLDVPANELARRVRGSDRAFIGGDDLATFQAMIARRAPVFERIADVVLDGRRSPSELVDRLAPIALTWWPEAPSPGAPERAAT